MEQRTASSPGNALQTRIDMVWSRILFMTRTAGLMLAVLPATLSGQGFVPAKYGGDFLDAGAGARALGMGGAFSSLAADASAMYWNPAGLVHLRAPDLLLMHSERFSGIVSYDLFAVATPLYNTAGNSAGTENDAPRATGTDASLTFTSTTGHGTESAVLDRTPRVGIAVLRQGVDGIQNTLRAWDPDRGLPVEDAEAFIEEFGVRDLAVYASFASRVTHTLSVGASVKLIHHRIGDFADAWGYGLDAGALMKLGRWTASAVVTDLMPMLKFWQMDAQALQPLVDVYGDLLPSGRNERVAPTLRLGATTPIDIGFFRIHPTADVRVRFEGRRAYALNVGDLTLEPSLGLEGCYRGVLCLRLGMTDLVVPPSGPASVTPAIGMGLQRGRVRVDYGFNNFAGYSSELGTTHRLSLGIGLKGRSDQ